MKTDTRKALQLLVEFIDDIGPQLGKLHIQDIAGLIEGLRLARIALAKQAEHRVQGENQSRKARAALAKTEVAQPDKCTCGHATAKNPKSVLVRLWDWSLPVDRM